MRAFIGVSFAGLWLAFAPAIWADTRLEVIKQKAEEMAKATLEENYPRLADFTHAKVVDLIGGRNKMIAAAKSALAEMKTKGFTMDSIRVEAPKEVVKGGDDLLAIVPMTLTLKFPDGKIVQRGYLVAVSSDKGKTWTFLDGAKLDQKNITQFLPYFPSSLKLPEKQKPVIEKDK